MRYRIALLTIFALVLFASGTAVLHAQQAVPNQPETVNPSAPNMLPAGTQLSIRTNEAINATKADVGRTFSGEIVQAVSDPNGSVILPAGAPVELTIADAGAGTMGVGSNQVALALRSINVNGRTFMVQTNTVEQGSNRGIGANKRTAEMTGGGALLGTLVGAMAGGGKGAAIGAVLGGGAGATAQVLTRGSEVKIPAESVLTFKLDQPLSLQ